MLDELAELIGRPGALALCALYGGRRLYIPATVDPAHPLVLLLGDLMAGRLAARFGRETIDVPLPPVTAARAAEARRLRAQLLTLDEIADELGVTRRSVCRLLGV
jgi:hypothetical protein